MTPDDPRHGTRRALGNGVVPQQAATAIRSMIEQQKTLEEA